MKREREVVAVVTEEVVVVVGAAEVVEEGGGEIRKREMVVGALSFTERERERSGAGPLPFPPLWDPHLFLLCATRLFKGHEKKTLPPCDCVRILIGLQSPPPRSFLPACFPRSFIFLFFILFL